MVVEREVRFVFGKFFLVLIEWRLVGSEKGDKDREIIRS